MRKRLHTAGLLAMLTTIVGGLSAPGVLNLLPAKVALALLVLGIVLQAVTKPANAGGKVLVPRVVPVEPCVNPLEFPPPDPR